MKLETLVGDWCPFLQNGNYTYVMDTNWPLRASFQFALSDTRPYVEVSGKLRVEHSNPRVNKDTDGIVFPSELLVYRSTTGYKASGVKGAPLTEHIYKTTTTEVQLYDKTKIPVEDVFTCLDFTEFCKRLVSNAPDAEKFADYAKLAMAASALRDQPSTSYTYEEYWRWLVADEYVKTFRLEIKDK